MIRPTPGGIELIKGIKIKKVLKSIPSRFLISVA